MFNSPFPRPFSWRVLKWKVPDPEIVHTIISTFGVCASAKIFPRLLVTPSVSCASTSHDASVRSELNSYIYAYCWRERRGIRKFEHKQWILLWNTLPFDDMYVLVGRD